MRIGFARVDITPDALVGDKQAELPVGFGQIAPEDPSSEHPAGPIQSRSATPPAGMDGWCGERLDGWTDSPAPCCSNCTQTEQHSERHEDRFATAHIVHNSVSWPIPLDAVRPSLSPLVRNAEGYWHSVICTLLSSPTPLHPLHPLHPHLLYPLHPLPPTPPTPPIPRCTS